MHSALHFGYMAPEIDGSGKTRGKQVETLVETRLVRMRWSTSIMAFGRPTKAT